MKLTQTTTIILGLTLIISISISILYLVNNGGNYRENLKNNETYNKIELLDSNKYYKSPKLTKLIKTVIIIQQKTDFIEKKLNDLNVDGRNKRKITNKIYNVYGNILNNVYADIVDVIKNTPENTPNNDLTNKIQKLITKCIESFNTEIKEFNKIIEACSSAEEIIKYINNSKL